MKSPSTYCNRCKRWTYGWRCHSANRSHCNDCGNAYTPHDHPDTIYTTPERKPNA